jgi:hypothetical protein
MLNARIYSTDFIPSHVNPDGFVFGRKVNNARLMIVEMSYPKLSHSIKKASDSADGENLRLAVSGLLSGLCWPNSCSGILLSS